MNIGIKLLNYFSYTPMIKFVGPRANLPFNPPPPLVSAPSASTSAPTKQSPAIIIPSIKFAQLTEEQIELINMGGAVDPPAKKEKKEKKK